MHRMFFSTLFLFALGAHAAPGANRIECHDEADIGTGKIRTEVKFDGARHHLVDETTITVSGDSPQTTTSAYLSDNSVCGLPIQFDKSCTFREKLDPKYGYDYTFQCGAEITGGELYCDENCLTAEGSTASFRCRGPHVDGKLTAGLVFQGCRFLAR